MTTKDVRFVFYNYETHQKLYEEPLVVPLSYDGYNISVQNVDHLIKILLDKLHAQSQNIRNHRMFFLWNPDQGIQCKCDYEFQQIEYTETDGFLIRCYDSTWESMIVKETYIIGDEVKVYMEEKGAISDLDEAWRGTISSATFDKGSGRLFPTLPISSPGGEIHLIDHLYWKFKPQYQFVAEESDAFHLAAKSVVRLYIEDSGRKITTGTAFFVSPQILATSLFLVQPQPDRMWISTSLFSTPESTFNNYNVRILENGFCPLELGIDVCFLVVEDYVSKHYLIPNLLNEDSQFGLVSYHDYPRKTDILREFKTKIETSAHKIEEAVDITLNYTRSFYPNSKAISPGIILFDQNKQVLKHSAPATNGSIGAPCVIPSEIPSFSGIHIGAEFASYGSQYCLNQAFGVNNDKFLELWRKLVLPELHQLSSSNRPLAHSIERYMEKISEHTTT